MKLSELEGNEVISEFIADERPFGFFPSNREPVIEREKKKRMKER